MKVLHYISSTGLGRGEVYIDLANELCKTIDVTLLIPKGALYKSRIHNKIEIIEYSSYDTRNNPLLLIELLWKICKIKPDLVHTHFAKSTEIFYKLNKLLRIPHVATKHNARKGKIFNKLNYVIAVSKDGADSIKAKHVKIIYNGIVPESVTQYKKPDDIFHILAVGRLDKIKGFDILINECSKLQFPFKLEIVGDGPEKDNLHRVISEKNLDGQIKLIGFQKDIPQRMHDADVVVMSSYSEGFSVVMVESLFYAKLFISTRVSGATEILEEQFLCEQNTIADKLNDIYLNEEMYKNAFENLKTKCNQNFLLTNITKQYIDLYRSIIEKR